MLELTVIQQICVWAIPVLFAITVHEAAHGYAAYKLGDPTAKLLNRLTLNPIAHIDPIGTIVVPIALGLLTNFSILFGWAKPVPVTKENFKNQRRDTAIVAFAGPFSNLVMAILWGASLQLTLQLHSSLTTAYYQFFLLTCQAGMIINIILIALNILPIPPLDGSRIVSSILPPKTAYHYDKLEPYGLYILILLIATNTLSIILSPILRLLLAFIKLLVGL